MEEKNKVMTNQHLIYRCFLFLSLLLFFGCQEKSVNEELNQSSKIDAVKIAENTSKERPAILYKSTDLGRTWSSFSNGIPADATVSGIKQYDQKIYITTDYHGVFLSSDGKDNWTSLNVKQLKGLDINCLEVAANKLVIGTLNDGIFVSNDGGLNWKPSEKNIKNTAIRAFIKSDKKLLAGTDAGIFESVDMGDTWSPAFGQMQILGFTSLNDKIYAATQHGALVSDRDLSNWKSIYDGDALHDIGNDGTYIYAMTIGQQLLKTKNDGLIWENAQRGIIYPKNFYTNEIQHLGEDIFSAQWIGIYHSSDHGNNWHILNDLPEATAFSTLEITDFGIIAGISIR